MKKRISVGILVNDKKIKQWIFLSIDNLVKTGNAEVTLLIDNPPDSGPERGKRHPLSKLIIKLFELADLVIFYRRHNYNRKRDINEIKNISGIVDLRRRGAEADIENERLTSTIVNLGPDVIVKFGEHKISDQITEMPKYGVWAFSIDRNDITGGPDYGFWEVVRYKAASYSAVELVKKDPGLNETIYGSWESTCPFSVNTNRNKIFCRAALSLPRLINGLSLHGEKYLLEQIERAARNKTTDLQSSLALELPSVIRDITKGLIRISGLVINKLIYTDAFSWQLLIDIKKEGSRLSNDYFRFRKIPSPSGLFWADPFVVAGDERYYVFVEEFIYRENRAHIALLEIDGNGSLINHQRVIDQPYHMSYPFVFRSGGSYYMIPETAANKTIEFYRCTDFPYKWQFEKYIMKDVSATDTTLFHYGDKWWLFTTMDQTGGISGGSTELFLFYSDDPLTDNWIGHPLNPVVSDERSARCAGNLFMQDGEIYRPSQDCSMRYGKGLNINRVTKLNEREYNEVVIEEIEPDWDHKLKGAHTLNFDKNFTIIDTYKFHRRISL